jgi:hypothetical protein
MRILFLPNLPNCPTYSIQQSTSHKQVQHFFTVSGFILSKLSFKYLVVVIDDNGLANHEKELRGHSPYVYLILPVLAHDFN